MRSLGVIFLADVVGYSKMMASDEIGTLNLIRTFQKETIAPTLTKYGGTMIKSLGDGWLIEFKSASNAVNCAMAWQSISKQQGKMSLRVGIHLGDVEHEEGPPPDVYGDTVNIAARLESIAENGEVAISASTYLCLDENQAKTFNNCGKQTLKNISTPVEVWSTGRLNIGSKGMTRENAKPLISIKPFVSTSEVVGGFCEDVTHDLEKYLNQKDWIDSTVQKNPSENDYQLIGTVSVSGPNFTIDVILKAPGGKALWSKSFGAALRQINLVSDTVANQISSQIFLEIMKVRDKFKS
jgi:class 3 adenylate cyclase/TolB-like protein